MDRKGIVIILVTVGIVIGWHFGYYAPRARENQKRYEEIKRQQAAQKAMEPVPATRQTPPPVVQPEVTPEPAKVAPSAPEERKTVSSEVGTVDYIFTNHGGGISRVVLKEHFEDKAAGTPIVLNEFGGTAIGVLAEKPDDEALTSSPWAMSVDAANYTVTFERTVPGRVKGVELGQIKITKKFTLPRKPDESDKRRVKLRSEYLVGLEVTHTNVGETATSVPKAYLHIGGAGPINRNEQRMYQGFDFWREGNTEFKTVDSFAEGGILFWKHPARPIIATEADLIRWVGVTNQYFTTMVTALGGDDRPIEERRGLLGVTAWARHSAISPDEWRRRTEWRPNGHEVGGTAAIGQVDGAMGLPEISLSPNESATRNFQIYAGPREYRRLRLLDHHESDILDYGSFLGIPTGMFSRLLLNSMNGLHAWTGNYALAIVLLTIIVKGLLWPLQNRANNNMKKMSALQPEMKRLQERYKEEPVKFQQEMGKVWKKAGVNPLSGCWPIFIQVPIFIGFYNMLGKAVELRHHGFWWVKDLSQPDTIARIAGLPINPLPLLMAGTMLLQMKVTPQSGDPSQRRMLMFMPLIFIFMCYNFASALALYWTVQNLISIVQLFINKNKNAAQPQLAAAK
jgi:YidC/Oxa1 family membrane protein insertase